ncbi:MAG: HAD hydrolase-like protein, partial [Firmicutes bacterium]|nr:HAD hydrolase-like protein [Bacillota bacterium]
AQACFVGDNPVLDVEAARRAGFQAIWFRRHQRAWYGSAVPPNQIVETLQQVPSSVQQLMDHRPPA